MAENALKTASRVLQRQKRVTAPDYPFYVISLYEYIGYRTFQVTLEKADIGYVKTLFQTEYNNPLEAFLRFEAYVDECMDGKYDRCAHHEGDMIE